MLIFDKDYCSIMLTLVMLNIDKGYCPVIFMLMLYKPEDDIKQKSSMLLKMKLN